MKIKLIGSLVCVILFLVVIMQNTETVETDLLFVTVSMPRAALLFLTLLVGVGLGLFAALMLGKNKGEK